LRVVLVNRSAVLKRIIFRQTIWLGVWLGLPTPTAAIASRSPTDPKASRSSVPEGRHEGYRIIREWMWMDSMILPQVHLT
jgi:hypothetical protein